MKKLPILLLNIVFFNIIFIVVSNVCLKHFVDVNNIYNKLFFNAILESLLVVICLGVIIKLRILPFSGLKTFLKPLNVSHIFFPLLIVSFLLYSNYNLFNSLPLKLFSLYIVNNFTIGFFEELFVRVICFSILIKIFEHDKNFIKPAISSSILFGLLHYINIFTKGTSFDIATGNVFVAFCIGVYFTGLFLKTGSIIVPAILHSLIDIVGSTNVLTEFIAGKKAVTFKEVNSFSDVFPTIIIFSLILYVGIVMIKNSDTKYYKCKLKSSVL